MMVCRFLLGAAETMFGPGVPVYFSYFYPRRCLGARVGIFISASALANAYGGALAYALSHIHSHVSNWRFLFIVEGTYVSDVARYQGSRRMGIGRWMWDCWDKG